MYGWMMGGPGAWWILWLLLLLLVIAIVVLLIVGLTRRGPSGAGPVSPPSSSARVILDERYARGEIDHEEYVRRREELGRSGG